MLKVEFSMLNQKKGQKQRDLFTAALRRRIRLNDFVLRQTPLRALRSNQLPDSSFQHSALEHAKISVARCDSPALQGDAFR
jgi:hypothetical protein